MTFGAPNVLVVLVFGPVKVHFVLQFPAFGVPGAREVLDLAVLLAELVGGLGVDLIYDDDWRRRNRGEIERNNMRREKKMIGRGMGRLRMI